MGIEHGSSKDAGLGEIGALGAKSGKLGRRHRAKV